MNVHKLLLKVLTKKRSKFHKVLRNNQIIKYLSLIEKQEKTCFLTIILHVGLPLNLLLSGDLCWVPFYLFHGITLQLKISLQHITLYSNDCAIYSDIYCFFIISSSGSTFQYYIIYSCVIYSCDASSCVIYFSAPVEKRPPQPGIKPVLLGSAPHGKTRQWIM